MNVMQAAQYVGVSDKTIRRAIHAGKLRASYPKKNLAEIAVSDLEAWYAGATIRPLSDETPTRLIALEQQMVSQAQRIQELEQLVDTLLQSVQALPSGRKQRLPKLRTTGSLPSGLASLAAFADLHGISQNTALTGVEIKLIPVHKGDWRAKDGSVITLALDAKGQAAFYRSYNSTATFTACPQCPHNET